MNNEQMERFLAAMEKLAKAQEELSKQAIVVSEPEPESNRSMAWWEYDSLH